VERMLAVDDAKERAGSDCTGFVMTELLLC
jgi:hypothetical protein